MVERRKKHQVYLRKSHQVQDKILNDGFIYNLHLRLFCGIENASGDLM